MGWYGLACLEASLNHETQALEYMKLALDRYFPRADLILKDAFFDKLKKTKRFMQLMDKYFREESKFK